MKRFFLFFGTVAVLAALTVSCGNKVTDVQLNKNKLTLSIGETQTLVATVSPADADTKEVDWKSSNSNVATVNNGTITGIAVGDATITVTTKDGKKTADCLVTVIHPGEGEMVFVEGGTFTMGEDTLSEGSSIFGYPMHQVTVSGFAMGKYEVTQKQWTAVMGNNPSLYKGDNLPVEGVLWEDAQEFISRLNAATGKSYRLPTEAEWEYAARGGQKSKNYKYSGSDDVELVAWHNANCENPQPVGMKQPNELGIYDMSGNVYEWCSDFFGEYSTESQINPTGPTTGDCRVIRGGDAWEDENTCRIVSRQKGYESIFFFYGLRLVLP